MMEDNPLITRALLWLRQTDATGFLSEQELCETRDVFGARLDRLRLDMEREERFEDTYTLVTAVVGEIGNNSFDHNTGRWHDVPGVFFMRDMEARVIVVADRGQGILATILRVRPDIKTDKDALHVALTERVSGRAPEQRGNGLKFVVSVVADQGWKLYLSSGDARAVMNGKTLGVEPSEQNVSGVLAALHF